MSRYLTPRQLVRATPEALRANSASVAPWSGLTGVPAGFADGIDNNSDINRATLSWDVATTTGVATSRIYPLMGPGEGAAANATEFDTLASRFSTACSMTATARIYPTPVAGQDSVLRLFRVNASDPLGTFPSEISLVAFNAPGVDTGTSSPISILAGQRVTFRYTKAANSTPLPVPTKIYVEWTCN
jgi:hypothetical protein